MSLPFCVREPGSCAPKTTARKAHRSGARDLASKRCWQSSVQAESSTSTYENQMLLLDRAFTSLLHDRGNLHYRYYILDTLNHQSNRAFTSPLCPVEG